MKIDTGKTPANLFYASLNCNNKYRIFPEKDQKK